MNQLVISHTAMSFELCQQEGQERGRVGGFWAKMASWLLLGLAVESHWLALGKPFLSTGLENSLLGM